MHEHIWRGKTPDEQVPTVSPADVKAAWQLYGGAEGNPGMAVGIRVFEHVCSPGADIGAISYRAGMLRLMFHIAKEYPQSPESQALAKFKNADELDDRLFEVMSRIPLKWIQEGGMQGYPFDFEDFMKQVQEAA